MQAILDIAQNDLIQILRDRKTFLFLLIMPIAFTLLFGYSFGSFSWERDPRLLLGLLDHDQSSQSAALLALLKKSQVVRLEEYEGRSEAELEDEVRKKDLAAALVIPPGYGEAILKGAPLPLLLVAEGGSPAGRAALSEVYLTAGRLGSAARIAGVVGALEGERPANELFGAALARWGEPPIQVVSGPGAAPQESESPEETLARSMAHSSPANMLQFAIAGLLVAAQMLVSERKSRTLDRLLTTATRPFHILLGHYLAIFCLIFSQFLILILFSQLILRVNYINDPLATLLVAVAAAASIAALGLLIGVLARSEEQAVIFSLIPMFVLGALGGAWVPLEVTGETFQFIGHASPVAWAMDGFENISARGLGLDSVWLPALVLLGYGGLFFSLAVWRFWARR